MNAHRNAACASFLLALTVASPASAIENPVVVDIRATTTGATAASATLFERGSIVLVNVTAAGAIPKNVAVTLNDGPCRNPGGVAFALSPFADESSLTQLTHSLSDVAGKAKSLVVHQTQSQTSSARACGDLKG